MIAADSSISTCLQAGDGLYVNLYVPADVSWEQGGASFGLSIRTAYPYEGGILLTLSVPSPQTFVVYRRIPAWAEGATVRVTGRGAGSSAHPGTFAAIRRG